MPSLLLVIFVFQLLIQIVNSIGATTLNELLWILYTKLPTSTSESAKTADKLRYEVLRLKKEMAGVSAQDEFSKWAKLRRQHDKASENYEKNSSTLQSTKSSFTSTASTVRFLLLQGFRFLLQWWYTKSPTFWIPPGWLPFYVEWILCFPRAPIGSVSVQVWGIACAAVLKLAVDAIEAVWTLATGQTADQRQQRRTAQKEKMAFAAGEGSRTSGASMREGQNKKEL